MSQATYEIYTSRPWQGSAVLPKIKDALTAIKSGNSGASAPSSPVAGMKWYDTGIGKTLIYTGSAWVLEGVDVGDIKMVGGSSNPDGWVTCDHQELSTTTYAALYAELGTTYGSGSGTFKVPDMRGRTPIGDGTGSGLTARSRGDSGGEEDHQLTVAQLAGHGHNHGHNITINGQSVFSAATGGSGANNVVNDNGNSTGGAQWIMDTDATSAGSDTAHNTMQPYCCVRFVIYTGVHS